MPTRIVLQEPTPPSRMAAADTHHNHNHNHNHGLTTDEEYAIQQLGNNGYSMGGESTRRTASTDGGPFQTPPRARTRFSNNNNHHHQHDSTPGSNSGSHRKVVGFRSSILRGTNNYTTNNNSNNHNTNYVDGDDDAMGRRLRRSNAGEDEAAKQRRLELNLSNEDIRASPRLLGYLFGSIGTYEYSNQRKQRIEGRKGLTVFRGWMFIISVKNLLSRFLFLFFLPSLQPTLSW